MCSSDLLRLDRSRRHPATDGSDPTGALDHVFRRVADEDGSRRGPTFHLAPRKAIKSQVLADFVAEWVDTQLPTAPIQPELWTMFFDGSLMKTGAGTGLLFILPLGKAPLLRATPPFSDVQQRG